ncbi:hypothetical protein D1F64_08475 [Breoghania sp. L-A4]|nr:hypothetical protein D1F64_08475 [Breoghania sp. L-A4]
MRNAESAIAVDYSNQVRRILLLRGEAYFEVANDPARPFSVDAGDRARCSLRHSSRRRRDRNHRGAQCRPGGNR